MKANPIQDLISQIRETFLGENLMKKYANEKSPLRAELFSAEQMEQYAKTLAKSHAVVTEKGPEQLLSRLAENEEMLIEVHQLVTESAKAISRISPAAEWLLDNFYLIEEQVYIGKKHLPKGYSESLPRLVKGPSTGLPRVYDIALEIISHSDGRVDMKSLTSFINAYQTVKYLNIGELWAIPIMLRLALIENLRRLASQIAKDRINRNLADYWANQMIEIAEKEPKNLIVVIADMAKSNPPMDSSFVAELTRQLLGKGPALALPLTWIEQRLSENGLTTNALVHAENQKQAADQVSMSNSISSLRFLNNTDWRDFVETTSAVEHELYADPSGKYSKMDFYTRDHYRHIVENIGKHSNMSELEVARSAVQLAKNTAETNGIDDRAAHVGYFFRGKGLAQMEKLAGMELPVWQVIKNTAAKASLLNYIGTIVLISLLLSTVLFQRAYNIDLHPAMLAGIALVLLISTSHFATTFVNWLVTLFAEPDVLPRMDFSKGIPPESRTLVVVPTMLDSIEELDELIEKMEVRFLANRDENLHFALLTDFRDAQTETLPGDAALLELSRNRIIDLNRKYGRHENDTFFLFHRKRVYNKREKKWMGYERKRGKLGELNALLRGRSRESFLLIVGEEEVYTSIKYVITLDTDTQLPREAAWKIAGTLSHPLNRPYYDAKKRRVTSGYTILQPRLANSFADADSSFYTRMHGDEPGIDPYTRSVSDVYQDLFHEGSFIGKGIYDLDTFELALNDRFPENRILSHDLLEGCYARSGLVSDVQLFEKYPSSYLADMKRRHRWIRGDWQIGRWLFPFVPGPGKRVLKNPLSTLSRWKIFDNLRRSLVPPALFLLLLFGWMISPSPFFWTVMVIAILAFTSLFRSGWEILKKPPDVAFLYHAIASLKAGVNQFIQHLFTLVCLPYEAWVSVDAIVRTNWRMFITHKRLLDWNLSSNISNNNSIIGTFIKMWIGPVVSAGIMIFLTWYAPLKLIPAFPVLALWIISPFIAWWVSLPFTRRKEKLSDRKIIFLQKLSRKTWAYFERFVTQEDNWLPPDNYQEHPVPRVAHRTSPTNIALSLLSNLSAFDLGYIMPGQLIERSFRTMTTMQTMERYKGHLYNWYDTRSLVPLYPRYISTVDSGNLAGHLLVLKQGLLGLSQQKICGPRLFEGMRDTVRVLEEKVIDKQILDEFQEEVDKACSFQSITLEAMKIIVDRLLKSSEEIAIKLNTNPESESHWWARSLVNQCHSAYVELITFAPLLSLPPVPVKFSELYLELNTVPLLIDILRLETDVLPKINDLYGDENTAEENDWLNKLRHQVMETGRHAKERIRIIDWLVERCLDHSNLEYDFLYDRSQHLLSIGYNVEDHRKDMGFYDLLGSESRLGIFVAIAQGKISQDSWFALGRQLTGAGTSPVLLSWSGSMFEYLMPLLVMPPYENTLLDQTHKGAVDRQIKYGNKRGVPWGISESGYNMVDVQLNYQYRAFGVPGLGLKRGLGEDLVIAPYASAMALMVHPEAACNNLEELTEKGYEGEFGLFEAIDYTPSRLPRGQSEIVIRSFMAHHQGMSFLSFAYLLCDKAMQKRFESEVQFQATLLLLKERIPKTTTFYSPSIHVADTSVIAEDTQIRVINTPHTPVPEVQFLSNGRYHVMVTNGGGGYSRWNDVAITRWREDGTCDDWGTFCYIRDVENNVFWSAGHQPSLKQTQNYEVFFTQGRAEFRRRDNNIETHTEIVVSPEDDVEMRRIHITNRSRKARTIEITSYAEIVLNWQPADESHPAFSNLFVQTHINPQRHGILCSRRPRSITETPPWMFHLMKAHGAKIQSVSYETDRSQFIGRGNSINDPHALQTSNVLSGNEGSVLDPIVSIQYRIVLNPSETAIVDMIYGIAETHEVCNGLIEKYQDKHMTDRAFELAWTHSQVVLRQINATEADAQLYGRLASSVIFNNSSLRADPGTIIKNHRGQSALWSHSVSGDLPIVLLQVEDIANIELVRQLVQAHAYWRLKGLVVDLVIWNEDYGGYRQTLQNQIVDLIAPGIVADIRDRPGGIFIRSAEQISNEDRVLFQAVARVIITDKLGTLEDQISRRTRLKSTIAPFVPKKLGSIQDTAVLPYDQLQFYNGMGGFTTDGKEYIIHTSPENVTPLPWSNVIANPHFGTVISESGQSYTWVENAHELRLTPWYNNPVSDTGGEAYYLRDEESGHFWSPTPLPCRGKTSYNTRHGFGYSVFEHIEDEIYSEVWMYVDLEAPIKFVVIKVKNSSGRDRSLSVTGFVEWVLGDRRSKNNMHIVTDLDIETGAIFAKNFYNVEFGHRVAFFDVEDPSKTITADREEFIGRNRGLKDPDAMHRSKLSGKTGAALDPCAAAQVMFDVADGEEKEIIFRLGTGRNAAEASKTVRKFRGNTIARDVIDKVRHYWDHTLGAVQIETPDLPLNILTNGWLNYQTLACRMWGRSGYYQSGGAFGFRDQLQDVLSLMHAQPALAREQILRCASRQFREGDVQHWWHPPGGRGVRTRCSDDYLWLPFVTSRYIKATMDTGVLNERIHYLEGRPLNVGEESYYDLPIRSDLEESLYDHCLRAIDYGRQYGEHGLPLMGSGDWNDGMDKVGEHGRGESVWLAFFYYDTIMRFMEVAKLQGDNKFVDEYTMHAEQLRGNIEKHAWDGAWYRRAYFDDGMPLGSSENDECQIDSIAQSWSVLSKAADGKRSRKAVESAYNRLVRKDFGIIQLFDPPFDKSKLNPGYIKGYVPGVRENGGQYTHAAIWLIMALAALGDKKRTWELIKMINPVYHGLSPDNIASYKVEPYVIAADVYAVAQHKGRGGWTWYTGSAGWMYQLIIESLFGITRHAQSLHIAPCLPPEWQTVKVNYRYYGTTYQISFLQDHVIKKGMIISVDGKKLHGHKLELHDDGRQHKVEVILGIGD